MAVIWGWEIRNTHIQLETTGLGTAGQGTAGLGSVGMGTAGLGTTRDSRNTPNLMSKRL